MTAHIDAGAGVRVLPPGAAGAGVLVDDREGDPGLAEANAGEQARLPASDDHDREIAVGDRWCLRRRHSLGGEVQLAEHHRHGVVGDLGAADEGHHLLHQLG